MTFLPHEVEMDEHASRRRDIVIPDELYAEHLVKGGAEDSFEHWVRVYLLERAAVGADRTSSAGSWVANHASLASLDL